MQKEEYLKYYYEMKRIRLVEKAIADNYNNEIREMRTPIHLSDGQEAIAVGVCQQLNREDMIFSNHRSHGHYLAKGGSLKQLIAELFLKEEGCCHGRGGSMHLMDKTAGVSLSSAIVAGNVSIGTGAALANSIKGTENVSVVFLGDGASEEGSVYESICYAQLRKLPVVFICENNLYAIGTPLSKREPLEHIADKFSTIIRTQMIDGNDIILIAGTAKEAIDIARRGEGPSFIECKTYRLREHHNVGNGVENGYRTQEEVNDWEKKSPIVRLEQLLFVKGFITEKEVKNIDNRIEKEIAEAFEFAQNGKLPMTEELEEGLWG